MGKLKLIIVIVMVAIVSKCLHTIFRDGEPIKLPRTYWGPKSKEHVEEDRTIYPFKINVDDKILRDLKSRLNVEIQSGRLAPPLEGIGFQYGVNTEYLEKVLKYWHTGGYDWRVREKLLNKWPQFKTKIDGLDIHFQHIKNINPSKYPKGSRPLLILHGWAGSFVEFQKIIPLLTEPDDSDFNFELIIPSLPGFAFSDTASKPGLGPVGMSPIFLELMHRLGHQKFYIQGGDWGAIVTTNMATLFPENVLAMHLNFCVSLHPRSMLRLIISSWLPSILMTPEEAARYLPLSNLFEVGLRESGYFHLQATKPDTIGVALSQSPGGLAAYILEIFSKATNMSGVDAPDGLIPSYDFTMDEILDNIMVYWVTNSITSSLRIYAEALSRLEIGYGLNRIPVTVPTACMQTTDRLIFQGRWVLSDKFQNLAHYSWHTEGGHFVAMEKPKLLADDVFQFFRQLV